MVDRQRIDQLLALLREYVGYLARFGAMPVEELQSDPVVRGAVERYLQLSIQAALDVGQQVIAMSGLAQPRSYADIFVVLADAGVLERDFAKELQAMARLRNRLVHVYGEVDPVLVSEFIRTRLEDFDRFAAAVTAYLDKADAAR